MPTPGKRMPRYRCHKEVFALKIQEVNGNTITFSDPGYPPIEAGSDLFSRYMPAAGDYYVIYDDGYASISPRKAFEEGYTKI